MNQEHTAQKNTRVQRVLTRSTLLVLIALALAIAVNLAVGLIPEAYTNPDVTGNETFRITQPTLDLLDGLQTDVNIYFVSATGSTSAGGDLYAFLTRYEAASSRIRLDTVSADDSDFAASHADLVLEDQSIIVESDKRYKVITVNELIYYYSSMTGEEYAADEYAEYLTYLYQLAMQGGIDTETLTSFAASVSLKFDGESLLTNAISYVTATDAAIAYVLTGENYTSLDSSLRKTLNKNGYDVRTVSALSALPGSCDLLIVGAPKKDLSENAAASLASYLANGGKLLLTTSQTLNAEALPNLAGVLATYGLGFEEKLNVVTEGHTSYQYQSSAEIFYAHMGVETVEKFVAVLPHAIKLTETENVTHTPWLWSSAAGRLLGLSDGEQVGDPAVFNFAVRAQSEKTDILWIACPEALTSTYNSYAGGGNFRLLLDALNEMTDTDIAAADLAAKPMETASLNVSTSAFAVWGIVLVILIPAVALATGIIITYLRKKK